MQMTTFGRTGLKVSVACLGTGGHSRLGQAKGASFEHSVGVVKAAMDLGINFIDTSVFYKTEEIVGEAIKGRRDKVVISTKNLIIKDGTDLTGTDFMTGAEYKARLEDNLRRLKTDYIDIFHTHGITDRQYDYCVKEIMPVVFKLRDEGKIRFTAMSERFNVDTKHKMLEMAVKDDLFDCYMVGLNFVNQSVLRHIIPEAKKKNIGIQSIYAVRGRLSTFEKANQVIEECIAAGEIDPADLDDRKDPLRFLITEGGATSLPNACYRFNRHSFGQDVVLTGTGSIDHLKENVKSINDPPLNAPALAKLKKIFARVETATAD